MHGIQGTERQHVLARIFFFVYRYLCLHSRYYICYIFFSSLHGSGQRKLHSRRHLYKQLKKKTKKKNYFSFLLQIALKFNHLIKKACCDAKQENTTYIAKMWLQRSHPDREDPSLNYGCHDMQRDSAATLNALAETQRYFFPLFWFWAHWIEAILTIGPIFTQIARAMFAYLQKSVRRLVNCHQSRNGPGPPRLYFIFFPRHVSRGRECRWSKVHDVSLL